ncbi:MAG: CoA pyrophosphatase [Candidatus Methanofastidiosia archaeon]|jgi:8-oxo-dGTP pyrophosphatase MutT (NUDIX family)
MYCLDIELLSKKLLPVSKKQNAKAAVVILLTLKDNEPVILFVNRIDHPKDPWSGQMALPGGKKELEDSTLQDTIIRETQEEVGINLKKYQFLGVLHTENSVVKPDMEILPFVVYCKEKPVVTVNKNELKEAVWISLPELEQNQTMATLPLGEFPAFVVKEYTIWGVTYRIMNQFLQVLIPG